jgi:uncharacterized protein (TIGR03435 family)
VEESAASIIKDAITLIWSALYYQMNRNTDTNGPSIFAALQKQLGLKLESTRGAAEVLIIDHVERPSEN